MVVESDSDCDEKDPMHGVAAVPPEDRWTEAFCSSDTGAKEIDNSVEYVSSAARAAESVKKQSTFSVWRVQPKSSTKGFAVKKRSAKAK